MNAPFSDYPIIRGSDAERLLRDIAHDLRADHVVPYLGPGLIPAATTDVPMTPEALAAFFAAKVALPRRAKGNAWASAQHIESTKHRSTVSALMTEAFTPRIAPSAIHTYLAGLDLSLIVDTWYDAAMREAMRTRIGWGEIQGITRAGIGEDRWYRFYQPGGEEVTREAAETWRTVLYKPHGSIAPARNYLISDADYVEVLTEIDIQTPIPDAVKHRRVDRHILFLGCRFHDQLLRTYARQIMKRSTDVHWALVSPEEVTKNEMKFMASQGIIPIALPLDQATAIITGPDA